MRLNAALSAASSRWPRPGAHMTRASEFRSAFRSVRRGRWLSGTVVLILAVAIGGATAIFSIAHAVLVRPLPVEEPARVVILWGRDDARSQEVVELSLQDRRAWLAGQRSLTAIALFGSVNWGTLRVTGPGQPFRAVRTAVSSEFFDTLGARPMIGRTFRPSDGLRGARRTVVLSADVWRRHFSSDASVVGRLLTVGTGDAAAPVEVIGVMPPEFRIPAGADVWTSLGQELADAESVRAMFALGRLAPGATVANAVAELSTIARQEELNGGMTSTSMEVVATPLTTYLLGPTRPALLAIAGASTVLLLMACANVTALLLIRGSGRRREIAVRCALGARRLQILRQLFWEAVVLSLIAGAVGVGLAYVSFDAIVSLAPLDVPRLDEAALDIRALLFALLLSLTTAIIVGIFPAWRHSSEPPLVGLSGRSWSTTASPSSARVRRLLVTAQVAAVVVLLTAAGLFIRSFTELLRLDLGFDPRGVLTFSVNYPDGKYDSNEDRWRLVDAVVDSARRVPGVLAAGAVYLRPFEHGAIGMDAGVIIEGQPLADESASRNPIVNWEVVTPDYFRAMAIPLIHGRSFDERDTVNSPPVVIVGKSLAARLWPGQDAIGRRLLTHGAPEDEGNPTWQTVVGVVADARYREVDAPRFDLYLPYRQAPNHVQHFVVRSNGDPLAAIPALRTALAAFDPDASIDGTSTMESVVNQAFAPWRFSGIVVSLFAALALGFAAAGIAALVTFAVTQRTREIAVRVALGAQQSDVVALVAREGVWTSLAGLVIGVSAAWMLRASVESMLFGVAPGDPWALGGAVLLLGAVCWLSAYVPARRAGRIGPAAALHVE
jgi:putative ABC transport system permease protein